MDERALDGGLDRSREQGPSPETNEPPDFSRRGALKIGVISVATGVSAYARPVVAAVGGGGGQLSPNLLSFDEVDEKETLEVSFTDKNGQSTASTYVLKGRLTGRVEAQNGPNGVPTLLLEPFVLIGEAPVKGTKLGQVTLKSGKPITTPLVGKDQRFVAAADLIYFDAQNPNGIVLPGTQLAGYFTPGNLHLNLQGKGVGFCPGAASSCISAMDVS